MKILTYFKQPSTILLIINLISLWGTIVYWFYGLNWLGQITTLVLTALTLFIIYRKQPQSKTKISLSHPSSKISWLILIAIVTTIIYLLRQRTTLPLLSPWTQVNRYFWLSCWLIAIVGLITIKANKKISTLTIIAWWLLIYGIASCLYSTAYGFDPFIHQAAEKTIIAQGQISPKTPYYLGQYSLVITIYHLTGLAISSIERWLLPLLVACFLPWFIIEWFKQNHRSEQVGRLAAWLWPIFSWPIFIVTVPQNCAYFLLVITIMAATWPNKSPLLIWSSALASLACHPLAGLPAITIALLSSLPQIRQHWQKIIKWLAVALTALVLPLSLWLTNWQHTKKWQLGKPPINTFLASLNHVFTFSHLWPNQEHWLLNLIYGWQAWQPIVAIILILTGWYLLRNNKTVWTSILKSLNLSLIIAIIFTSLIPFDFVIDYERYNYLARFSWLAIIINLPAAFMAFGLLAKKWLDSHYKKIIWPIIIALTALIIFSLYLTYPRDDRYSHAQGLSTSQTDFLAVQIIENQANDDYIVLANQQVSAAALAQYGFYTGKHQRYLQDDIFYYPIPTSGILYPYYLKMVNDYPSRQTIAEAAKLAGVHQAYFVLNDYWYGFEKLAEEAAAEADEIIKIANGAIIIFVYKNL